MSEVSVKHKEGVSVSEERLIVFVDDPKVAADIREQAGKYKMSPDEVVTTVFTILRALDLTKKYLQPKTQKDLLDGENL